MNRRGWKIWLGGVLAAVVTVAAGCGDDPTPASTGGPALDIVQTAEQAGVFGTLLTAVETAELTETLRGPGPFTVFAPTDDAFAALPEGTVASLLLPENRERLVAILTYHVLDGSVLARDAIAAGSAETLSGQSVTISSTGGVVRVDGATVVQADVLASNGVIHVIDAVLLPEE